MRTLISFRPISLIVFGVVLVCSVASPLFAHPGGLDASGCIPLTTGV